MDGSVNAAVQSGFENVDLSGYTGFGASVTAISTGSEITGTASTDRLTGGKGADTFNYSTGNDITTGGAGADTFKLTDAQFDNVSDASNGTFDGGTGSDTVSITDAASVVDADMVDFSTVEVLDFTTNLSTATVGSNFEAAGFTTIDSTGASLALTTSGLETATTGTLITGYDVNVAGESLAFGGTSAAAATAITGWTVTNGVYSKAGASVADFYAAIAGAANSAGDVAAFIDDGNTYVFAEGAATTAGDDSYVTVVGVAVTSVSATHGAAVLHVA